MVRTRRHGATLIEILVAIAIIAILIGLLIPAVQKVRDAAARTECSNHLKQLGLAIHSYHDQQKMLPSGVRSRNPRRLSTWLTHILPYVEQENLWTSTEKAFIDSSLPFNNPPHIGLSTVVPVYICPSDGRVAQPQHSRRSRHLVAFTSYLGVSGRDLTTLDGVFFRDSRICMADVTDGTSNTLMVGERPPSLDF